MPVQIGQKPESDFQNPLGLLSDCHRRIERFLVTLVKLSDIRVDQLLQPDERAALESALLYFRTAAPKHTADEEDSLFPRLRAKAAAASSLATLEALEADHVSAARDHEIVDAIGIAWLRDGSRTTDQVREMSQALHRLSSLYTRHIAIEDNDLFPAAARVLRAEELAEVGREMAGRRNVWAGR